ncbi:hypothetical protein ACQP2E_15925 [Actinoplanes sp. CA-015351]|uniref:tetratricopeptide repeat protein n=1 Tax=Actinoplanes sp. CA-015351 TaxID=3239897 RepID=UPI003D961B5A
MTATAGFAYGVIGADIHVFGDGSPIYLLQNWRPAPTPDPHWLRELPSRMLHARLQVVTFTGRRSEIDDLRRWRDTPERLAVRWLYGAGGQGKTRIADHLAAESTAAGWKCVVARHGAGTVLPPPGGEDLRLDGTAGVLLLVDYADQWPLPHLTWLLSNALLHRISVPARVLMLARSADIWPPVRAALADLQATTSSQHLTALPSDDGRAEMFRAARDSFASCYGASDPGRIPLPASLPAPEMGLTLAVHMAALVALDTYVTTGGIGCPPPTDVEGLTIYLLDREHLQWARLFSSGEHRHRTPAAIMNRAVFIAALTGTVPRARAAVVLSSTGDVEQVIADHSYCYPPADARMALEPLYPDRLAEDFLALTLPGHTADYPAQSWAPQIAATLIGSRGVTFLVAAAERWPHVRMQHLFPILRGTPQLATQAGSAVLTRLAAFADADLEVLELIDAQLPLQRHVDLDVGAAAIGAALLPHRVASLSGVDADLLAITLSVHAWRLSQVGRADEAVEHLGRAVAIRRERVHDDPAVALVSTLVEFASALQKAGRPADAVAAGEEAVAVARAAPDDPELREPMAYAMQIIGVCLLEQQRLAQAAAWSHEAVTLWRRMTSDGADEYLQQLAQSLLNHGNLLWARGHHAQAPACATEAVQILRRLSAGQPARYLPDLAMSLHGLAVSEFGAGLPEQATPHSREATGILRELASANPDLYLPILAAALDTLANLLSSSLDRTEAMACRQEATAIQRALAERNPVRHVPGLAKMLSNVGTLHSSAGDAATAVACTREATGYLLRLVEAQPEVYRLDLAAALSNLGSQLGDLGATEEAITSVLQAVSLIRAAAPDNPGTALPALTRALGTLSHLYADLSRIDEALRCAEEAAAISRQLTRRELDAHLEQLSKSLTNLSIRQASAGILEQALITMREVVDIRRRLARGNSAPRSSALAQSLRNLAVQSADLGRPEQALPPALEALQIEENLASARPAYDRDDLAHNLVIVARLCVETGRHDEAVQTIRRATAVHRLAAMVGTPATARKLRDTLATCHSILALYGYAAEASQLRQELGL